MASPSIVVEQPDGSDHQEFDIKAHRARLRFTPDGAALLFVREFNDERALALLDLATGETQDLLAMSSSSLFALVTPGLSVFSPDGKRVIQQRGLELVSVALDGSGVESIATGQVSGGYTGRGDVVVVEDINTEDPPDDTPEFVYSAVVISPEGDSTTLYERSPDCAVGPVSDSGNLIGVSCNMAEETTIVRPDGGVLFETSDGVPIAFDRHDRGVILRGQELRYQTIDGKHDRLLGLVHGYGNDVDAPYVDYAP